jgi:hypothetical protein
MLTRLRIRNFRGFRDHTLPLRGTTLVVGRNNAGKSSIVEALRLVSIVTTRFGALGFRPGPDWGGIPKREHGVSPSLKGLELNVGTLFHHYGEPPAVIDATFANLTAIRIYIGAEDQVHAVVFDPGGQPVKTKAAALRADLPVVEILPQIAPLETTEVILTEEYVRRTISSGLFSRHFRNQLWIFSDRLPAFKAITEQTWPSVQLGELTAPSSLPGQPLSLMIRDEDFVAEVAAMGHGLQMWLQTMWFLARIKRASSVILDEPDVYMHPDLQRRLLKYLRKRHEQVIIATHSVEMMSEAEPEDILVVDRRSGQSEFASNTPVVQRLVEHLGSTHNLQLARLWNARKCLLVEGRDDVHLLGIVHRLLYPDADSLETIPHIEVGGWGGWSSAIGSSLLLQNSGGEDISVYCILDSDYHSREAIVRRHEDARRTRIRLHIWRRKEIENYFLAPDAIISAIRRRMPARTESPTVAEIMERLEGACEDLKEEVFDAIAADVLAEDRRLGAGGANRLARETLTARWGTLDAKLGAVSGKRLFAELSRWSQNQFGASLSAAIVAKEMAAPEIPDEMREVIEAIEESREFITSSNEALQRPAEPGR